MSTVHSLHPDVTIHGLQDNCPRCEEHATHLHELDTTMLFQLKARLELGQPARSDNEMRAIGNLDQILSIARRLGFRSESPRSSSIPSSYPPGMSPSERSNMQRYK